MNKYNLPLYSRFVRPQRTKKACFLLSELPIDYRHWSFCTGGFTDAQTHLFPSYRWLFTCCQRAPPESQHHQRLHHPKKGALARAYLFSERGLKGEAWSAFRLGCNPRYIYDLPERWGFPADDKKIRLPRGIVIPGLRAGVPCYIKVRRPLPNDLLIEYLPPVTHLLETKFSGPLGGVSVLCGVDQWSRNPWSLAGANSQDVAQRHQTLLLVEGEWDAMLCWQFAAPLYDVGPLGGAANHPALDDLALLLRYPRILAVFDNDPAGDQARADLITIPRMPTITPPAHDLTDFWRETGKLYSWL